MKRWRGIAAALLIVGGCFMFASCAGTTTAVGVTTTQDADKADKPLR